MQAHQTGDGATDSLLTTQPTTTQNHYTSHPIDVVQATAHVLGIYQLPQGKKVELEKEMKEWMKQQDETSVLQSPREQSIRKCTKEHKKV